MEGLPGVKVHHKLPASFMRNGQWLQTVFRNGISVGSERYRKRCKPALYACFFFLGADIVADGIVNEHFVSAFAFQQPIGL